MLDRGPDKIWLTDGVTTLDLTGSSASAPYTIGPSGADFPPPPTVAARTSVTVMRPGSEVVAVAHANRQVTLRPFIQGATREEVRERVHALVNFIARIGLQETRVGSPDARSSVLKVRWDETTAVSYLPIKMGQTDAMSQFLTWEGQMDTSGFVQVTVILECEPYPLAPWRLVLEDSVGAPNVPTAPRAVVSGGGRQVSNTLNYTTGGTLSLDSFGGLVSFWYQPNGLPSYSPNQTLFEEEAGRFRVVLIGTTLQVQIFDGVSTLTSSITVNSTNFNTDRFHHIVASFGVSERQVNNGLYIYLDGVQSSGGNSGITDDLNVDGIGRLIMGTNVGNSLPANGYIDDVRASRGWDGIYFTTAALMYADGREINSNRLMERFVTGQRGSGTNPLYTKIWNIEGDVSPNSRIHFAFRPDGVGVKYDAFSVGVKVAPTSGFDPVLECEVFTPTAKAGSNTATGTTSNDNFLRSEEAYTTPTQMPAPTVTVSTIASGQSTGTSAGPPPTPIYATAMGAPGGNTGPKPHLEFDGVGDGSLLSVQIVPIVAAADRVPSTATEVVAVLPALFSTTKKLKVAWPTYPSATGYKILIGGLLAATVGAVNTHEFTIATTPTAYTPTGGGSYGSPLTTRTYVFYANRTDGQSAAGNSTAVSGPSTLSASAYVGFVIDHDTSVTDYTVTRDGTHYRTIPPTAATWYVTFNDDGTGWTVGGPAGPNTATATVQYAVRPLFATGYGPLSPFTTITTGWVRLDATHFHTVSWTEQPGALSYAIYKYTPNTVTATGIVGTTFIDSVNTIISGGLSLTGINPLTEVGSFLLDGYHYWGRYRVWLWVRYQGGSNFIQLKFYQGGQTYAFSTEPIDLKALNAPSDTWIPINMGRVVLPVFAVPAGQGSPITVKIFDDARTGARVDYDALIFQPFEDTVPLFGLRPVDGFSDHDRLVLVREHLQQKYYRFDLLESPSGYTSAAGEREGTPPSLVPGATNQLVLITEQEFQSGRSAGKRSVLDLTHVYVELQEAYLGWRK